mgnify:CR=1 FL=1
MIIVLANGCFDILHVGHIRHLQEAREMGDKLIVSLTVDNHVNKGPGRPIYSWADRAECLKALSCVDCVIPSRSAVEAINGVIPNIFVKGIDYAGRNQWTEDIEQACKSIGADVRFTKAPKQSVTDIIKKVHDLSNGKV